MNTIITSAKNLSIQSPFRITIPIRNEETNKYSTLQAPYKSYRIYEKSKTLENKHHIGKDVLNSIDTKIMLDLLKQKTLA